MDISLSSGPWKDIKCGWLIVGITETPDLSGPLGELDSALNNAISRLIEAGDLKGKPADLLPLHDVPGIAADRVLFVGLGDSDEITRARFDKAMMTAIRNISTREDVSAAICLSESCTGSLSFQDAVESTAMS